jgi:hypothetical protein
MKKRSSLLGNVRGVAAVEFALLSIPLLLLVLGGIEYGFRLFNHARLRDTLDRAGRMATIGNADGKGIDGAEIDAFVTDNLKVIGGAKVEISKTFYDQFDQVHQPEKKEDDKTSPPYCWWDANGNRQWDVDPSRDGTGGANDIINYRVTLRYPALFPFVVRTVTGQGDVVLSGQQTLQNEPFGGGSDMVIKKCCISAAAGNPVDCK